jgi:hypothetical protein
MQKVVLLILISIFSLSSFAQSVFTVSKNQNSKDMNQCQDNHNIILNSYKDSLNEQISKLITGINYEMGAQTSKITIQRYKDLLTNTVVKKVVLDAIYKKFNSKRMNDLYATKNIGTFSRIIDSENLTINIEENFDKVLKEVTEEYKMSSSIQHIVLEKIKGDIKKEVIKLLVKKTFTAIGNGFVAQILGTSVIEATGISSMFTTSAVMSFSASVIKGVGVGIVITLVTKPLMGARNPPEYDWTQLLNKHPELIINPEWMSKAGIKDSPWFTHCHALIRRTKHVEKALNKLITNVENEFLTTVQNINRLEIEYQQDLEPVLYNKMAVDNTYVHIQKPAFIDAPSWAR